MKKRDIICFHILYLNLHILFYYSTKVSRKLPVYLHARQTTNAFVFSLYGKQAPKDQESVATRVYGDRKSERVLVHEGSLVKTFLLAAYSGHYSCEGFCRVKGKSRKEEPRERWSSRRGHSDPATVRFIHRGSVVSSFTEPQPPFDRQFFGGIRPQKVVSGGHV